MWATIVSAVYVIAIISAVHAVMSTRTSQGAIAWSVSLLSFPFLAVPLYWVFGRNKFEGLKEARREHEGEITSVVDRASVKIAELRTDNIPIDPEAAQAIDKLAGQLGFLGNNDVELLIDGEATFDSIIEGIGTATELVLVQFYIVRNDDLGNRLADAVIAKAREGVACFFLYDEIGSFGLSSAYTNRMQDAGVAVAPFHTTQGRHNRFQLNFRNHRKIVVVDGHTTWIGGHNVGNEYLGLDPKIGPWRDTHVKVRGPVALQAQGSFLGDWFWAKRELPDAKWEAPPDLSGTVPAVVIPSSPAQELETASLVSIELCNGAKHRIWIATPYFVPDRAVMAALRLAALRDVDVRILITAKADSLPVDLASYWYIDQLQSVGIKFFHYTAGFMHQKCVLVDHNVGIVGTVNWDSRSFRLNFEVNVLAVDKQFAQDMEAMFEADFARSVPLEPGILASKNYFFRVGVHVSRLLSPIL